MQSMLLGAGGVSRRWSAPKQRYLWDVRGLGLAWSDGVLAYRVLAQSALRFVGQVAVLHLGVLRAEQSAVAMKCSAPMYSMGAGIDLATTGIAKDLGSVELLSRRARVKLATTIQMYVEAIRVAAEVLDAAHGGTSTPAGTAAPR